MTTKDKYPHHIPVLLDPIVSAIKESNVSVLYDATLGAGGHTNAILNTNDRLRVIASDRDANAIELASAKLDTYINTKRLEIHNKTFEDQWQTFKDSGFFPDAILMDLGVSSMQIDSKERGFSFRYDTPLDMRMDQRESKTAFDIINRYSEKDLQTIIRDYAEENRWKAIARAIVSARKRAPIKTTFELIDITKSYTRRSKYTHGSTQLFQAIRIETNDELNMLKRTLNDICDTMTKPGLIMVISFHSLEDRIIKHVFREKSKEHDHLILRTKKPIIPTDDEKRYNKRSRSAKLRIMEVHV
jgi:16S rRNA (cytosine1402-N4)-methyltransferase